jgi:hypothetical protein
MRSRLPVWLSVIIAVSVLMPVAAMAQAQNATLGGTITDPSGSTIPGANVVLTNTVSGTTARVETKEDGTFVFPNLVPITYDIRVSAKGFRDFLQRGIVVNLNDSLRVPITLLLGDATQTVEVSADASPLNYDTAEVKSEIRQEEIQDLPLTVFAKQRSAAMITFLMPGVNTGGWTTGDMNTAKFNGGQMRSDEAVLDGVSMVEGMLNKSGMISINSDFPISPDAVEEMTVLTSSYDVSFGSPSAVEVVSTRKGTPDYHGGAYEFLRNEDFNATPWGAKTKPKNRENDFGAFVTAPLKIPRIFSSPTKKSFVFVNFEGYRSTGGTTKPVYTLPDAKMLAGDFSEWPYPIYDPATSQTVNGVIVRQQFMGCDGKSPNVICSTDPRLKASLAPGWDKLVPAVNRPGLASNWEAPVGLVDSLASQTDQWDVRGDQYYKDKDHFELTFHYRGTLPFTQNALPVPLDNSNTRIPNYSYIARFNYDHTFSPTLLNHFAVGYLDLVSELYNSSDCCVNQVPSIPGVYSTAHVPAITIGGYTSYGGNGDSYFRRPAWVGNDMLTWVKGSHTFKFGAEMRNLQYPFLGQPNGSGTFNFTALNTGILGVNSGNAYASFLLGYVGSASASYYTLPSYWAKEHTIAGFVGDTWKAAPKLTVTLGLRWDGYTPPFEGNNKMSFLSLSGVNSGAGGLLGTLAFSGTGWGAASYGARYPEGAYYVKRGFAPRLGLAYALNSKTVINTGFGLFVMQPYFSGDSGAIATDGFNTSVSFSSGDAGLTPAFLLQNGVPQTFQKPPFISPTYLNGQTAPSYRPPYGNQPGNLMQWNLQIQHQLSQNQSVVLGYVGNKGTRLPSNLLPLNVLNPKYLSMGSALNAQFTSGQTTLDGVNIPYAGWVQQMTGCPPSVAQALLPFPQYCGNIRGLDENLGNSTYESLQAKYDRRLSKGLSLLVMYTLSKNIADTDTEKPGSLRISPFQQNRMKGLSSTDVPHNLTGTLIYQLPFGKGRQFLNSGGMLDKIIGGWGISTIVRLQSGVPIQFYSGTCNIPGQFAMGCLPGILPGQSAWAVPKGSWTPGEALFNKSAFEPASSFNYYGGSGSVMTTLRGFPFRNQDLSAMKDVKVSDRFRIEIRISAFNVLNLHNFDRTPVNVDVSSPSFGLWDGNTSPPRNLLMGAKVMF